LGFWLPALAYSNFQLLKKQVLSRLAFSISQRQKPISAGVFCNNFVEQKAGIKSRQPSRGDFRVVFLPAARPSHKSLIASFLKKNARLWVKNGRAF